MAKKADQTRTDQPTGKFAPYKLYKQNPGPGFVSGVGPRPDSTKNDKR